VASEEIRETLEALFAAERRARQLHDDLASKSGNQDNVLDALSSVIDEFGDSEGDEGMVELICAARLLGEFEGARVADALIDLLDCSQPEVRSEAGEQLQGLAYDRFKEVALGVERALERFDSGHALVELPYLLAEIPEGGVVVLLRKFLAHGDGDAVAAAIEGLVEVGDPSVVGALTKLIDDKRTSQIGEDEDPNVGDVTIGELAREAIELMAELQVSDGDADS
jgi:HEAT repeat protein